MLVPEYEIVYEVQNISNELLRLAKLVTTEDLDEKGLEKVEVQKDKLEKRSSTLMKDLVVSTLIDGDSEKEKKEFINNLTIIEFETISTEVMKHSGFFPEKKDDKKSKKTKTPKKK